MKAIQDRDQMRVAYAAATDTGRPVLTNVRIGDCEIVATAGFMLARRRIPTKPPEKEFILIPAQDILQFLKRGAKELKIVSTKKNGIKLTTTIEGKEVSLVSTPSTDKYPDYRAVHKTYTQEKAQATIGFTHSIMRTALRVFSRENTDPLIHAIVRDRKNPIQLKPFAYIDDPTEVLVMPAVTEP